MLVLAQLAPLAPLITPLQKPNADPEGNTLISISTVAERFNSHKKYIIPNGLWDEWFLHFTIIMYTVCDFHFSSVFQMLVWHRIKCVMLMIHLAAGCPGSRLQTLYRRMFWTVSRGNEYGIYLWNRRRSKSGQSLLSSVAKTHIMKRYPQLKLELTLLWLLQHGLHTNFLCVFITFQGNFRHLSKCCRPHLSIPRHFSKVLCPCGGFIHHWKKTETIVSKNVLFSSSVHLKKAASLESFQLNAVLSSRQKATATDKTQFGKKK